MRVTTHLQQHPGHLAAAPQVALQLRPGRGRPLRMRSTSDYHARAAVSGKNARNRPGTAAPDACHLYPHRRVRHLSAACELGEDKLFLHIRPRKIRGRFLEFCRYLRSGSRWQPAGALGRAGLGDLL
jgi:hypothetical protein